MSDPLFIASRTALAAAALALSGALSPVLASSHREAPFITTSPKVDGTDLYMFMSYEAGRTGYVTLIANYQPLQDAYGGPNYFKMDPNALYEIHIDNNGDAVEDLTFQFRFNNTLSNNGKGAELMIGGASVASPLTQTGMVNAVSDGNLNVAETYSVKVVRGDRRKGSASFLTKASGGSTVFEKPSDFIGDKTLGGSAAYETYAQKHVHTVNIPGCNMPARVFVGQRQEGFAVRLGPVFDSVNYTLAQMTDPTLKNASVADSIQDKNVTTLALEVHKSCLKGTGNDPVIGAWTTASLRQARLLDGAPKSGYQTTDKDGGAWVQVSRLGNPLINELVIGLRDKDKFNASKPKDDLQFATYVTNPTLPALLGQFLTGNAATLAPTNLPRADLVGVFLTGITVLPEIAVAKIRKDAPFDTSCYVGCGVTTGVGAVVNTAKVQVGDNVVVFGLGGIGLNVIQGARLAGAKMIVGVDINPDREEWGRRFGMTHFLNTKGLSREAIVAKVAELTDGGADYSFDATGNTEVMRTALECCHRGWGTSIVIGVAEAGKEISTRPFQLVTGRNWRGTAFGGARGRTDTPKIVDWYMDGMIQIDPMITHRLTLDEINKGFDLMHAGESIRSVVIY